MRRIAQSLIDARQWLQKLPPRSGENPLVAAPLLEETLLNYFRRGEYDEWWAQECNDQTPYWDRHADIPCLITGGWFDPFIDGTTEYFESMHVRNSATARLVIGPWGHGTMRLNTACLGNVNFGTDSSQGYPAHSEIRVRWFDRWLRDTANGVDGDPPVKIFVMGGGSGKKTKAGHLNHGGRWRKESSWPIERTDLQTRYLTSDGRLTIEEPDAACSLRYHYDPSDPVPSAGGNLAHLLALEETEEVDLGNIVPFGQRAATYRQRQEIVPWGPMDQREAGWMIGNVVSGKAACQPWRRAYLPDRAAP